MAGRPREVEDDAIFAATNAALAELGYARLSLAAIAGRLGVSPATLVKRFGSKRDLLLAFYDWTNRVSAGQFAVGTSADLPPLAALRDRLLLRTRSTSDPSALLNLFSFFYETMADPAFHALGVGRSHIREQGVRSLLERAVAVGDLERCDVGRLARLLLAAVNGAYLMAAFDPERTVEDWLVDVYDGVMAPYRPSGATTSNGPRRLANVDADRRAAPSDEPHPGVNGFER